MRDDDAGEQRQCLADIFELFDDARHDEDHQRDDDEGRDHRERRRIGDGGDRPCRVPCLAFLQIGEAFEDFGQRAGAFARRDHGAIQRRKAGRARMPSRPTGGGPRRRRHGRGRGCADMRRSRSGGRWCAAFLPSGATCTSVATWRVNSVSCLTFELARQACGSERCAARSRARRCRASSRTVSASTARRAPPRRRRRSIRPWRSRPAMSMAR